MIPRRPLAQSEAVFRLFEEYCRDQPLERISKDLATKFLDDVARLSPTWGRSPRTKALSVWEILDKFGNGREGLSNKTLNRYSSSLAAVFKWAEKRGYWSGENPFKGQFRKAASHRKTGWLPFTDGEVSTILNAAAEFPKSSAMHWVPLIAAYSGMHSNEICSLTTADIREQDGVHFFDVTGAKTEAGDRRVPIHSRLIEAGLLEYWKEQRERATSEGQPEGQLFPALKPGGPDRKRNWYFTKQFHGLRQRLGIDRDRIGFHSFRKSVATKLENARIPESEAVQVLGHEKLSMSYRVYSLGVDLRRLKEICQGRRNSRPTGRRDFRPEAGRRC